MWITTTTGYLSVVQHKGKRRTLVARARVREDLEPVRDSHAITHGSKRPRVIETPEADYPFRVFTTRQAMAHFLTRAVEDLDYGNFKDAVGRRQGYRRAEVYGLVWGDLRRLEEPPQLATGSTDDDEDWWLDEEGQWRR